MSAFDECPAWCERREDYHPDAAGLTIHGHAIGNNGVMVEWCPGGANCSPLPYVYVPTIGDNSGEIRAADARQLAADLIAAANVIEGASGDSAAP